MESRLGRIVHHDPLSKKLFSLRHNNSPIRSVTWPIHAPVLDQGDLGSCTGNALAQWINTTHGLKGRKHVKAGKYLIEADAVSLYSAATRFDDTPGTYPPDDTGSSGLAVCKAGVNAGYLLGYLHAFGFNHFQQAIMQGPVIVGTTWTHDMFLPDSHGVVHTSGPVAGGHEYLVYGMDTVKQLVLCRNSWGVAWGINGHFYIPFDEFANLLADQGDVTIPVSI